MAKFRPNPTMHFHCFPRHDHLMTEALVDAAHGQLTLNELGDADCAEYSEFSWSSKRTTALYVQQFSTFNHLIPCMPLQQS